MDRINSYINYGYAQEKAYEVLLQYTDGTLPIDPFQIIKKTRNITLKTFTQLAKELQKKRPTLSLEEIKLEFESEKGFLKKRDNKKYLLCYNEQQPDCIIRWTLFHELGHYFLEHLTEKKNYLFFGVHTENYYKDMLEKEANYFAKHCSCPFPIAIEILNCFSNTDYCDGFSQEELLQSSFGMSGEVINYVLQQLSKNYEYYPFKKYRSLIKKFEVSVAGVNLDFVLKYLW